MELLLDWLIHQSPAIVVLALVSWNLDRRLGACIDHTIDILETLLERTNPPE